MSSSMIATIYLIALVVFFIILVVLTIAWIAAKSRNSEDLYDEYDDEDEYDDGEDTSYDEDGEEAIEEQEDIAEEQDNSDDDIFKEAGIDSAFGGSVISDETYVNTFDDDTDSVSEDTDGDNVEAETSDQETSEETEQEAETDSNEETEQETETDINEETEQEAETDINEETEQETETDTNEEIDTIEETEEVSVETEPVGVNTEEPADTTAAEMAGEGSDSAFVPQQEVFIDSAFAPQPVETGLTNEALNQSVKEAVALGEAVAGIGTGFSAATMFGVSEEFEKGSRKHHKASVVPSTDDFFWFNKMDVAERPSYKTPEMYYHYFDTAKDCIEDLLIEMYDCALVRTEEIRYIAYGIEPRAISMKEILSSGNYMNQQKLKEPTTQDLVRIYEKWCGYVDKLFDKVEIHADEYTINEIRRILCEYGRSDVDVLLEGK